LIQPEFCRHLYFKRTILNPCGIEIGWLRGPGAYSPSSNFPLRGEKKKKFLVGGKKNDFVA
jgi:hypothetical protein